jgi:hypothetical protein
MYAAWIEGATEADIQAIRNAMDERSKEFVSPFALAVSPDSASSAASSRPGAKLSLEKTQKKVAERVGFEPTEGAR